MSELNVLAGYRKMLSKSQKEFAKLIDVTEGTYRNKENGKSAFNAKEIETLYGFLNKRIPFDISIDIFFTDKQTNLDELKEVD